MKMEQIEFPKRRLIKFRRRGITQKKTYNIELGLNFCFYISSRCGISHLIVSYEE
jgi:hypothetical protein